MNESQTTQTWRVGGDRRLTLDEPRLIGVLNVTHDSFSDGGLYLTLDDQLGRAMTLIEQGASVLDIGGESTRPGAGRISADEQIDRTLPLIERIGKRSDVLISIDTTLSPVAEAALDAGAHIINDVSAGLEDQHMLPLAAERGCGLVLMHRLAPPDEDSFSDEYEREPVYDDVVAVVRDFLLTRCDAARRAGVEKSRIVIDPGLGFGKSVEQNYQLIGRTAELVACGYPLLSAGSRKSFIGAATGVRRPQQRVFGSVALSAVQCLAGVRLFRVHDVAEHCQALTVTWAMMRASKAVPGEGHDWSSESSRLR